jgi:hypothetical protein
MRIRNSKIAKAALASIGEYFLTVTGELSRHKTHFNEAESRDVICTLGHRTGLSTNEP